MSSSASTSPREEWHLFVDYREQRTVGVVDWTSGRKTADQPSLWRALQLTRPPTVACRVHLENLDTCDALIVRTRSGPEPTEPAAVARKELICKTVGKGESLWTPRLPQVDLLAAIERKTVSDVASSRLPKGTDGVTINHWHSELSRQAALAAATNARAFLYVEGFFAYEAAGAPNLHGIGFKALHTLMHDAEFDRGISTVHTGGTLHTATWLWLTLCRLQTRYERPLGFVRMGTGEADGVVADIRGKSKMTNREWWGYAVQMVRGVTAKHAVVILAAFDTLAAYQAAMEELETPQERLAAVADLRLDNGRRVGDQIAKTLYERVYDQPLVLRKRKART